MGAEERTLESPRRVFPRLITRSSRKSVCRGNWLTTALLDAHPCVTSLGGKFPRCLLFFFSYYSLNAKKNFEIGKKQTHAQDAQRPLLAQSCTQSRRVRTIVRKRFRRHVVSNRKIGSRNDTESEFHTNNKNELLENFSTTRLVRSVYSRGF